MIQAGGFLDDFRLDISSMQQLCNIGQKNSDVLHATVGLLYRHSVYVSVGISFVISVQTPEKVIPARPEADLT